MQRVLPIIVLACSMWAVGAVADDGGCKKLSLRECVTTKGCSLDCRGKAPSTGRCEPYECRAAKGKCENEYAQWDLTKEKCESLKSCVYSAASCFCPGPELCTCGGGPAAMCQDRK